MSDVKGGRPRVREEQQIIGLSVLEIGKLFDVDVWDVVKLDCEGAEYGVLLDWPGPIANQITVEFHEHTGANEKGIEMYQRILRHLKQWYRVIQHETSQEHGIKTPNYWDSLFVLKELYDAHSV